MKQLADCIDSSEDITETMLKISRGNYWSFFNYELFEMMTTTFCKSKDVIDHLDSYKSYFQVYCMRRLPAIIFEAMPNSDSVLKFYIKIDSNFTVSVNDIKNIQHVISKMLDVNPLYLIDVKDGCVELHFGCFKDIHEVFPLGRHEDIRKYLAQLQAVEYLQCREMKIELARTDLPETTTAHTASIMDGNLQEGSEIPQVPDDGNTCGAEISAEELPGNYIRIASPVNCFALTIAHFFRAKT